AGGADLLLVIVFLALALLLRWSNAWGFFLIEQTRWHVWHVPEGALWTVVLLIVLLAPLRLKVLFSNPMLARLGVLSYSIYLLHMPLLRYSLRLVRRLFPNVTGWNVTATCWFAIVTLLCVALASITYRFIERPFLVRKARLDGPARAPEVRAACACGGAPGQPGCGHAAPPPRRRARARRTPASRPCHWPAASPHRAPARP